MFMADQMIIAIVVIVVLSAHGWLFVWIRFKMDEGTILKFVQESCDHGKQRTEIISANTHIAKNRVSTVCSKSKKIEKDPEDKDYWVLKK